jgi:hypothetical protein
MTITAINLKLQTLDYAIQEEKTRHSEEIARLERSIAFWVKQLEVLEEQLATTDDTVVVDIIPIIRKLEDK